MPPSDSYRNKSIPPIHGKEDPSLSPSLSPSLATVSVTAHEPHWARVGVAPATRCDCNRNRNRNRNRNGMYGTFICRTCSYGLDDTVQPQRLGSPALPTRARLGYDRRQSVASELRQKAKRGKGPRGGRECTGTSSSLHDEPLVIKRGEPEVCARCRNNTSAWRTCPLPYLPSTTALQ